MSQCVVRSCGLLNVVTCLSAKRHTHTSIDDDNQAYSQAPSGFLFFLFCSVYGTGGRCVARHIPFLLRTPLSSHFNFRQCLLRFHFFLFPSACYTHTHARIDENRDGMPAAAAAALRQLLLALKKYRRNRSNGRVREMNLLVGKKIAGVEREREI